VGSGKKGDTTVLIGRRSNLGLLVAASLSVGSLLQAQTASAQPQPGFGIYGPSFSSIPTAALPAPWMEAWGGGGFTNNSYYGYYGFNRALNPTQNLWIDGFVLRGEGSVGHYTYEATGALSNPEVDFHTGGLLIGYRKVIGQGLLTGYLGVNYEHHDNPDPTASIRGTKAGVKFLAEYYTPLANEIGYFYGQGWYSTAFDTWLVYGSLPFKIWDRVWLGPEAAASGNHAPYQEARVGGIIRFERPLGYVGTNFLVSGGYKHPLTADSGPDGYYVNFHLNYEFR
jgi:hypothetical protein